MTAVRAVLQVADEAAADRLARSVTNILADLPEVLLSAVAHGGGIALLTRPGLLDEVLGRGVDVAVCRNALLTHGLDPGAVEPPVRVVGAGLAELIRLQHAGWASVRL